MENLMQGLAIFGKYRGSLVNVQACSAASFVMHPVAMDDADADTLESLGWVVDGWVWSYPLADKNVLTKSFDV